MRRPAIFLLAFMILLSCAAVYAAGTDTGESLVTTSYLENTYFPDVLEQAQTRVEEQTQSTYQSVLSGLDTRHAGYLALAGGEMNYTASMTDFRFKQGDVISLTSGSGALLLAGSGTISYSSGGVVDVTAGQSVAAGSAFPVGHRCLAAEDTVATVTVTSATAVLSLEGAYAVSTSGEVDYNALADALKDMGLFQGTGTAYGSGYDLEQVPTRIVGLVMFLRLIGEEEAALAGTAANPFVDTPAWCDRYVAYAYEKGYTNGTGVSDSGQRYFGPDVQMTAGEYVTFLLRALGYSDSGSTPDFTWDTAILRAVELGVLTSQEQAMLTEQTFLRAQVVYLSCFALNAPLKDGSGILLDRTASSSGADKSRIQAIMDGVSVQRLN